MIMKGLLLLAFINAYQKTLRSNVSPDELERARNKMNSLGLSPKQKGKLKDMTMEDQNKKEEVKEAMSGQNKGGLTKPKMMYGGVANKKKHNYAAGGSVKDRLGVMIAVGKIKPSNAK